MNTYSAEGFPPVERDVAGGRPLRAPHVEHHPDAVVARLVVRLRRIVGVFEDVEANQLPPRDEERAERRAGRRRRQENLAHHLPALRTRKPDSGYSKWTFGMDIRHLEERFGSELRNVYISCFDWVSTFGFGLVSRFGIELRIQDSDSRFGSVTTKWMNCT